MCTEIGLIEMDAGMNTTPYKTLVNLPEWDWSIFEIENFSILLAEGRANEDKKLTFYRIPIR
jgi:hypothetical protein